jgi:hypothetical protein
MDLGRPENVELIFRRGVRAGRPANPPGGGFKTKIDRCCELVTVNVFHKSSRAKQYLKDGRAPRIETVVNDARDLRRDRMLANLDELQAKARAINTGLLETQDRRPGHGTCEPRSSSGSPSPPSPTRARRRPRHGSATLPVHALAGALANLQFAVTGIANTHLRVLMTGLPRRPHSASQASYDLARLTRNGLTRRVPARNRHALTRDGRLFAHIHTKVHDRVLRPSMAPDQPNAPTRAPPRPGRHRPDRHRPHHLRQGPHHRLTSQLANQHIPRPSTPKNTRRRLPNVTPRTNL